MIEIDNIKLISILKEAINDYAAHADEQKPIEWIQSYLGEKLPDKTLETICAISSELISVLDLMEEKKASMEEAIEAGDSAENWFAKEAMNKPGGAAEKARKTAEFINGIKSAANTYENAKEVEVIDIDGEVWNDDEWNDYRLKSTFKDIASEVGKAILREIASETFLKATEEGLASLFENSDFVKQSFEKGALTGLKVAISVGLTIAEKSGVIPATSFKVIAATVHKTIESIAVFSEVSKGQKTINEAIFEIKNIAVSTFCAMWEKHGIEVLHEIETMAIELYGIKGALISGVITGLVTESSSSSKILNIIKEITHSIMNFLIQEYESPFFNSMKTKTRNTVES